MRSCPGRTPAVTGSALAPVAEAVDLARQHPMARLGRLELRHFVDLD